MTDSTRGYGRKRDGLRCFAVAWAVVAFLAMLGASSCSTVQGITRLDEMEAAELEHYAARTGAQVQAVAATALGEGDVTPEALVQLAGIFDALAAGAAGDGIPMAGSLAALLELEGYGALALTLFVVELDAELDRRGAYGAAGWRNAREVLGAVADGLRGAAYVGGAS